MAIELDSSALSQSPSFEITDPEQISGYMSHAFRPNKSIVRSHRSAVDFRHNSLQFGNTTINSVRYGTSALVDAPPVNDIYLAMFTLAGTALVNQGQHQFKTCPGTFCVLNPNRHLKVELSEDFEQLTVRLSGDAVRQSLLKLTYREINKPLEFVPQSYALNQQAAGFGRLVKAICEDMSGAASAFNHPSVSNRLEEALVNLLLTSFPHSHSSLLSDESPVPSPYFVKRAEEYLAEHLSEPPSITELAHIAGTSVRSLQSAFRHYKGTTPTTYLREIRLERVRQELITAASTGRSITEIAMAYGFTHLSKFSQYYKARFGELPSETKLGKGLR